MQLYRCTGSCTGRASRTILVREGDGPRCLHRLDFRPKVHGCDTAVRKTRGSQYRSRLLVWCPPRSPWTSPITTILSGCFSTVVTGKRVLASALTLRLRTSSTLPPFFPRTTYKGRQRQLQVVSVSPCSVTAATAAKRASGRGTSSPIDR